MAVTNKMSDLGEDWSARDQCMNGEETNVNEANQRTEHKRNAPNTSLFNENMSS